MDPVIEGSINERSARTSYSRTNLYWAVVGANSLFVIVGAFLGWTSPATPKLKEMGVSVYKITLMASLPNLAPGPIITMFGIDTLGRKGTLLAIWLTFVCCWMIFCLTEDINMQLIARFIGGWGTSASFPAIGIYISEIADVKVRGLLNSVNTVFIGLGILISTGSGPFISFDNLTIVMTLTSFIFGLFYFCMPESPYFYVSRGNLSLARSILQWLRKDLPEDAIDDELSEIELIIEEERRNATGMRRLCTSRAILKQFILAFFLLFFQQATAMGPVTSFTQSIFEDARIDFDARYLTIIIAFVIMVSAFPLPFILNRFGSKSLFIITGFGCAISNCVLAVYFLLLENDYNVSSINILPIVGVVTLFMFVNMGQSGIINAVISDLFAPSVKGMATGICSLFSTFLAFAAVELFGVSVALFGYGMTFLGFGVVLLISAQGYFLVPNITRMTLLEIQEYFEGGERSSSSEPLLPSRS